MTASIGWITFLRDAVVAHGKVTHLYTRNGLTPSTRHRGSQCENTTKDMPRMKLVSLGFCSKCPQARNYVLCARCSAV